MIIIKNIRCISLLVVLGLASSCSKFLEETSQSELVPRTVEALNELLLGEGYPGEGSGLHQTANFLSDDVVHTNEGPISSTFYAYTWQHDMVDRGEGIRYGRAPWSMYTHVQICNTVLDYLPKVEGAQSLKDYVEGQARLLRAFYYLKLVNFYGMPYNDKLSDPTKNLAVPLILAGGLSSERKTRNTVSELYTQIETDILDGIRLLDQSGVTHSAYRIGSTAGHLMASRMYLSMEKWDQVIAHADAVLAKNANLANLGTWGPVNPTTKPVVSLTSEEIIWGFGTTQDGITYMYAPDRTRYQLSADLIDSFEEGDLRDGIYFNESKSSKMVPPNVTMKVGHTFRVSEAFLNRAEAFAQRYKAGKVEDGAASIADLNTLREKRFSADKYVPWTLGSSPDELLLRIREERRREFFEEESHRWFDLRRYGMPRLEHVYYPAVGVEEIYVLEERDPGYVLQIPDNAISLNPNLQQNPLVPVRKPK